MKSYIKWEKGKRKNINKCKFRWVKRKENMGGNKWKESEEENIARNKFFM